MCLLHAKIRARFRQLRGLAQKKLKSYGQKRREFPGAIPAKRERKADSFAAWALLHPAANSRGGKL